MGNGMVIDLEHLRKEMGKLIAATGVMITPENLKISDRASHLPALPCDAGLPARRSVWPTPNTVPPAAALRRFTATNT